MPEHPVPERRSAQTAGASTPLSRTEQLTMASLVERAGQNVPAISRGTLPSLRGVLLAHRASEP
jgi:hypothetical protein